MAEFKLFCTPEEILAEFERQEREEEKYVGESGSDEGEDVVHQSDHDSNSTLSVESDDQCDTTSGIQNYFLSKDGQIKWSKDPVRTSSRTQKKDIITKLPGVKSEYRNIDEVYDAFNIFFSDEVINLLVENTNLYINFIKSNFKRERAARETDEHEIRALLGLLILGGVYRSAHLNFQDLWDKDGPPIFSITMSCERFLFLLRSLRFDDKSSRNNRLSIDKLAPIRSLLSVIQENFLKPYTPSEFLTIDEQLIPFRGRCSFRQYIPNKPKRYGIKVFAMVDAKTYYCLKFEIYAGKQPQGSFASSNSPEDIVLRLIEPVDGSGRNITTDNWYSSIPLATSLLDRNLTFIGTLKKNKKQIPPQFLADKSRPVNSSLFGFTKGMTMVSYVPKKSKAVIILTTMEFGREIDESTGEKKKPAMITFYNSTKGGVDTNDQMCANYNVGPRTKRWPLAIFFHLINLSAINAYVVYKNTKTSLDSGKQMVRRAFLKDLGHQLVKNYVICRSQILVLPRPLKQKIKIYMEEQGLLVIQPGNENEAGEGSRKKRKRCSFCPSTKDNKYSSFCASCGKCVCKEHCSLVCNECKP